MFTGFLANFTKVCAWDVTRRLPMALECSHFQAWVKWNEILVMVMVALDVGYTSQITIFLFSCFRFRSQN